MQTLLAPNAPGAAEQFDAHSPNFSRDRFALMAQMREHTDNRVTLFGLSAPLFHDLSRHALKSAQNRVQRRHRRGRRTDEIRQKLQQLPLPPNKTSRLSEK